MKFSKSLALGVAAATAATLGAATVVGAPAAGASERAGIPTVIVRMVNGHIKLDGGNTVHAGKTQFKVVTGKGNHILQILRLHRGYSIQQAGQDIGKAFGGDTDAIRRVDNKITWRGGTEVRPHKPGLFVVSLHAGHFFMVDQNGPAGAPLNVVGTAPKHQPAVPHQSTITAFTYGFESQPAAIPAAGTLYFHNQADQPHFLEMQHVKSSTTARMVRKAFSPTSHGQPAWVLKGSTGLGVVSPGAGEMFHYDLPAGKYVIACFWPDLFTGMPHAFMGMWKLITLK
jgi:hypothetical protein